MRTIGSSGLWLALGLVLLLGPPSGSEAPAADLQSAASRAASRDVAKASPGGPPSTRQAIERALVFLERDGEAWLEGRSHLNQGDGCVSCHVVTFAVWSHNEARRGGVEIAEQRIDDLTARTASFLELPRKGRPVSWGQILLARDLTRPGAADERWRGFRDSVIATQQRDGHWQARGQFPAQRRPIAESDAVATMWTTLSLATFDEYDDGDVSSVRDALAWIEGSATGESTEWLLARLLIEHRLGDSEKAQGLVDSLLSRQNRDGGWGFLGGDTSDAMTTGQALYALSRSGEPQTSEPLQKARSFLLETQRDDGTWLVPSGLISQSADEAKDYIYQYWGTAWATIGLSRSLGGS